MFTLTDREKVHSDSVTDGRTELAQEENKDILKHKQIRFVFWTNTL